MNLKLDISKMELVFDRELKFSVPAVRTIDQMREVLLDKDIRDPKELYYMYRDIHRLSDGSALNKYKLRYDVTVIRPSRLGKEFMKTAGHYHPDNFGELYEVVYGQCFCLLQRANSGDYRIIEEVILVEAVQGQKIVIPPGFGHILINPGPDCLITSNWVSSCFASSYELYKKADGAAYFVTAPEAEVEVKVSPRLGISARIIKNPYFNKVANISFAQPAKEIKRFGLFEDSPIYNLINKEPKALDFLNHPLDYEYSDVFVYTNKEVR